MSVPMSPSAQRMARDNAAAWDGRAVGVWHPNQVFEVTDKNPQNINRLDGHATIRDETALARMRHNVQNKKRGGHKLSLSIFREMAWKTESIFFPTVKQLFLASMALKKVCWLENLEFSLGNWRNKGIQTYSLTVTPLATGKKLSLQPDGSIICLTIKTLFSIRKNN